MNGNELVILINRETVRGCVYLRGAGGGQRTEQRYFQRTVAFMTTSYCKQ